MQKQKSQIDYNEKIHEKNLKIQKEQAKVMTGTGMMYGKQGFISRFPE